MSEPEDKDSSDNPDNIFVESTLTFVADLSRSVVGLETPKDPYKGRSNAIIVLLNVLEDLNNLTEQFKPTTDTFKRFASSTFREFVTHIEKNIDQFTNPLSALTEDESKLGLNENLNKYLTRSLGNKIRLDYGTGHELAFLCLLKTLQEHGILKQEELKDVVLYVFHRYFRLVRDLVKLYNLEPAGSKGVWGLDDYQFLPFIFGSAQLQIQSSVTPEQAIEKQYINMYRDMYMYIEMLDYITECKKGVPFYESSPMLYDISGIKSWKTITTGLIKMYKDRVLTKRVVTSQVKTDGDTNPKI